MFVSEYSIEPTYVCFMAVFRIKRIISTYYFLRLSEAPVCSTTNENNEVFLLFEIPLYLVRFF